MPSTTHALYKPNQKLDELRIRAEIETANRATTKRPTWAPPVILDGELLELCREVEFLTPDDKPVARLWATFADPKRRGTVIRTTFSKHPMDGVRCRGFEMRAGEPHSGGRMTNAVMDVDGGWSIAHLSWPHSAGIKWMRDRETRHRDRIDALRRQLEPCPAPKMETAEEIELRLWGYGTKDDAIQIHGMVARCLARQATSLEQWKEREAAKREPAYIERVKTQQSEAQLKLDELQRQIAKEEASPDWRYKALTRMTELATQRLAQFIGDPEAERRRGAQVTGACFCCGKTLTDTISVERGIGPECVQHLRIFDLIDLVKLKDEMVAAHPDKGGTHEAFLAAHAKYAAAKDAAETSFSY
jgi:hypothetical protein